MKQTYFNFENLFRLNSENACFEPCANNKNIIIIFLILFSININLLFNTSIKMKTKIKMSFEILKCHQNLSVKVPKISSKIFYS